MKNRKWKYGIVITLFAVAIILAAIILHSKSQELKVEFFDVGQGDAILISKGGRQILIDGGPSGRIIMEKLGKSVPFWDRKIDIIIATHPDQDHIGGLPDVAKSYDIGKVFESGAKSESKTYAAYENILKEREVEKIKAEYGIRIKLSEEIIVEILNPNSETINCGTDTNSKSVVTRLIYGKNSFLLTGDLPGDCEEIISGINIDIGADVLKVAHHGSKNSSTAEFLKKVSPKEAVISVGKNNRYSHPDGETLERLFQIGAKILRTDEMGDISYICKNLEEKCSLIPR